MNEAFFTQLPLYAALTHLGFILGLLISRRRSAVTRTFTLSNVGFLFWNFFAFVYLSNEDPLAERLSLLGLIFLPPFLYHFFIYFLDEHGARARWGLRVSYWVSAAGLVSVPFEFGNTEWWKSLVSAYVFFVIALLLKRMWDKSLETDSRMEHRDLRILLGMGTTAAVLGLTNLLALYSPLIPLGSIGGIVYTLSFAAAIIRRRLLSITEILRHALVPLLLTAGFGLLYLLLLLTTQAGPSLHIVHTLFVLFILLLLYRPMQILLQELMDHLFLGEGYSFQESLVGFSRRILSHFKVREILFLFKETLERFPKIGNLSVYLKEANQPYYVAVPLGMEPEPRRVAEEEDLIKALKSYREYLIAEDLRRELKMSLPRPYREGLNRTLANLDILQADLVCPLFSGRELIGFFSLSFLDKTLELHSRELGLIQATANQVAIALDNARIYEEMALKDRLASLGEMSAGLAHEIRGPLGAIKGAAQYLRSDVRPEEMTEFLQVIVEEVDRLNRVVSQFLDFARPLEVSPRPTALALCLENSLQRLRDRIQTGKVEVATNLDQNLPPILAERGLFEIVLMNLFSNALEAMPQGGKLTIMATAINSEQAEATALAEKPWVQIAISDSGIGIAPDQLAHIFTPFFTTREQGTGLGLPLVQKIVNAHGGALTVQSAPERGTTFNIRIPAEKVEHGDAEN